MKLPIISAILVLSLSRLTANELPVVSDVDSQPLSAGAKRIVEAMNMLGAPIAPEDAKTVTSPTASSEEIQKTLDRYAIAGVTINPESRVKVAVGAAKPNLIEKGWRVFLVKVANQAGVTAELKGNSPNARSNANATSEQIPHRWLDLQMFNSQPLNAKLGGLEVEYRIIQLYTRDAGKREAKISFNVGQGTQDIGFRNDIDILFTARPAHKIALNVKDENGKPTTAGFEIRDRQGRVYPSQTKRTAPDFHFHPQIYRADGEHIMLPDGSYSIQFYRGPESIKEHRAVNITPQTRSLDFKVKRWVDPSLMGWWSGDHHIHAAGCAHYTKPSEGVHAPDMMRHCLGEDLKVGANLTWGPCFDYQKQFFTGKDDKVSTYPYLLRYDVEVSGFGSHQSGHLCLLRLKEQMFPGGESKHHWPTLCLNTLKWAKKQGALVGPAHSGWGIEVKGDTLPSYEVPPYSGIGANEYVVDVTHEVEGPGGKMVPAVDFLSMVDTPYVWELNMWYHAMNCGFRTRISGETDFPCIYGERVGLGRSYVKLDGKLDYNSWCEGIRAGRNYVCDGRSHLIGFKVNDVAMGEKGSELKLAAPGNVTVTCKASAYLNEKADVRLMKAPYQHKPYWHIERARVNEDSRSVPVELIVNGYPVAKQLLVADGTMRDLKFENVKIDRSSWVALRILPSSHTNPVFIVVGDKPIRASKRSAEWCLQGVDQCWSQKERFIHKSELEDAKAAYQHAREVYTRIVAESDVD